MKVVLPEVFAELVRTLNENMKKTIKTPSDSEIKVSKDAERLLSHITDAETLYLHSLITRAGEK